MSEQPPFTPGDIVVRRKARYKVKSVQQCDWRGNGKPEWMVVAWRWIKRTEKYSGNAYLYGADEFRPE